MTFGPYSARPFHCKISPFMKEFDRLWEIITILRKECPWDREQTNESLKYKLIEEAYELVDAIDRKDWDLFTSEAGDVLLVTLMQIRIAEENGKTSLKEVLNRLIDKLIERHPHVFGDADLKDTDSVLKNWEKSKGKKVFEDINFSMPALYLAYRIGQKASRLGFDWPDSRGVVDKVCEEARELASEKDREKIEEELGDLLFSIVNLARHLGINPEDALRKANMKFVERFRKLMREAEKRGLSLEEMSLEEMDKLWEEVK